MFPLRFRRALVPVISLLDRSETEPGDRPSQEQEQTRFPEFPWDLRTLIAVFPQDAPFRFLNLNITLGLTGVPFDQVKNWEGSDPKDAFDLQFCLQGKDDDAVTYKKYHSVSEELDYRPGDVYFKLGEQLSFEGRWPSHRIHYRQPEQNLDISLELDSWPGFQWWAYSPRIYCHYTSFCDGRLSWKSKGKEGTLEATVLHDHGWGRNLLPFRTPLKVFRYEVLSLPGQDIAISLWTEGPGKMELRNVGLVRRGKEPILFMKRYECRVLEWETFENYAGVPCRVPRRWIGTQRGNKGEFRYEAERRTEPRPILGQGFLYGFDYQGRVTGTGLPAGDVEGAGYVEHMGFVQK